MQLVADAYYKWHNRIATTFSALLAVAILAFWFIPPLEELELDTGFSALTLGLAIAHILYGAFLFRREVRRNPWAAALYGAMLLSLNVINLIHNTGQLHSWYLIVWGITVFSSGIFGLYGVIGCSFLVTIYYILIETGPSASGQLSFVALGAVGGTYAAGFIGYLLWRMKFTDAESKKIRQLTGQLQTKQQQAELLIQSIADGMIVVTPEGAISLMNPAAAKLTEWTVEEAGGIDVHLVVKLQTEDGEDIAPSDNPFDNVFQEKKPIEQTLQLIGRNGAQRIVSLVVSPVVADKNEEVTGAIAIMRDVSATRAEEKRRADFISTASHEMRTPVAAIEGYLALAMNARVSSIDEKARSYLDKAHASTQHLGKLFQDLLTSAKAEDGRLVSHPTAVEMGEFMERLTDSLRFAAEKKGLLLDFVIGASGGTTGGEKVVKPLYYVKVDPDRLSEVITNLFDNAVKYTESGKISIGLTGNKEVVQLYIQDTGPGIPADDVPHLFQKFYRVDNSSTRTVGGTGLGLFICRKIVELYQGRIWVESEEGKGSTFYINLPRLSSQKANELIALNQAQQPAANTTAKAG
ncbi:MAG: PAS domain-containing sensor histidine kinase [Candidatus Saccharibacteria bacterium]|nr:PAS domain-containing sensor histidine kinase [Candidatus Saccharibacteria bacterium]